MKIAIIGAGFVGLASAWHLLNTQSYTVDLFDPAGIGGGASGIATGLLHPYPGEVGRRSLHATEGLLATKKLLKVSAEALGRAVTKEEGILRFALNEEQEKAFLERVALYDDIVHLGGREFLITSGITVDAKAYLEGLWLACQKKGGSLQQVAVHSLQELKSYDKVVIAAGAGAFQFAECQQLPIKGVKGQVLTCSLAKPIEKSMIAKGYVASGENPATCYLGATYEREYVSDAPDLEHALKELFPRFPHFFGESAPEILDCRAAVRVVHTKHYFPMIKQLDEKTVVITGMGSRGLLYHAYFAEQLLSLIDF
jgi:glycine/D-amino acid oxidase-like deaminating enzyme